MHKNLAITVFSLILLLSQSLRADTAADIQPIAGQDMRISGKELIAFQQSTGVHSLVFEGGFSLAIGANNFSGDSAVVVLKSVQSEYLGTSRIDYDAYMYIKGNVSVRRGAASKTTQIEQKIVDNGQILVAKFLVTGEVFATADKRTIADPSQMAIYRQAIESFNSLEFAATQPKIAKEAEIAGVTTPREPNQLPQTVQAEKTAQPSESAVPTEKKPPAFQYPVNISGIGQTVPKIESATLPGGGSIATITGRFYLWQKIDEKGNILELQADNAVIFYSTEQPPAESKQEKTEGPLLTAAVEAIYMSGNIIFTEGARTIRTDEAYYNFTDRTALIVNAEYRTFDVSRGIPIYLRADKLRQIAQNKFFAENITLTSSEFYMPQLSMAASKIIVSDTTNIEQQAEKQSDSGFDAKMYDVKAKIGDITFLCWPVIRSNLQRPDIPIKSAHVSYDNDFGASVETNWYLSRLLGLKEPPGVDSSFLLDYYGKRGVGTGVEVEYEQKDYFGNVKGYIINDNGEDTLGRIASRKDVEPSQETRGRFTFRHRQFLPYDWQLTMETSYLSDENFLEGFDRDEFNTDKEQETLLHLKRQRDNWATAFLGKWRINDFQDQLEELPSAEFHLTGQSLADEQLTFYSDTQLSRLRQRIGDEHPISVPQEDFSFVASRHELDMPLQVGDAKVVPFAAGTFGYDDRSGFQRSLVDGSDTGSFVSDSVWVSELGLRSSMKFWNVYPDVKSRLFDLNQIRHIVKPQLVAVLYDQSDLVVRQRDTLNLGVGQVWQTKRGPQDNQKVVDWMRLDLDTTFVNNSADAPTAPDKFIWNKPFVPLRVFSAPDIFNGDLSKIDSSLTRFESYGPSRNVFNGDFVWRVTDTMAVLSDLNTDMQSGTLEQLNIGVSRLRWPNFSYFIGTRYLRNIDVLDEESSNALTFAATYIINPRYTITFAQQYDFAYGANLRTDVALIRRYQRIYYGLTFSADQTLDRQSIMFSIWPEGVKELGFGSRKYMGLAGPSAY